MWRKAGSKKVAWCFWHRDFISSINKGHMHVMADCISDCNTNVLKACWQSICLFHYSSNVFAGKSCIIEYHLQQCMNRGDRMEKFWMVHHFPLPSRRVEYKELCTQLIGRISKIRPYFWWTKICIFLKKEKTLSWYFYDLSVFTAEQRSFSVNSCSENMLRGSVLVRWERKCHAWLESIQWWVLRAYGELWHCCTILRSTGTDSAWPWL